MSGSGGDWMCAACQHLNFKRRDVCHNCGYPKFGGPVPPISYPKPGDWYCTAMNCGAHNFASRSSCFRCGALKNDYASVNGGRVPLPPGWKPGDWFCTANGCGEHNYAIRTECHKCRTPRYYGGAV